MELFKDIIPSITRKKQYLYSEELEKTYNPFIVNRALSRYLDCVFVANEMNIFPGLDKKLQYDFFFNAIAARNNRTFLPWHKKEINEILDNIKTYYNCSEQKALEYSKILSEKQLETIKEKTNIGGIQK